MRRLVRRQKQLGGDLVGGGFLHPAEGCHLAHGIGLADAHDRHAGFAARPRSSLPGPRPATAAWGSSPSSCHSAARQMARRKMAGLVRHHPDQLVGRLHPQQDAGEDEDVCRRRLGGEGVHSDRPPDRPWTIGIEAGGPRQRHLIASQHFLGFGVAQACADVLRLGGRGRTPRPASRARNAGGKTAWPCAEGSGSVQTSRLATLLARVQPLARTVWRFARERSTNPVQQLANGARARA